jgi:hypothetical protein
MYENSFFEKELLPTEDHTEIEEQIRIACRRVWAWVE